MNHFRISADPIDAPALHATLRSHGAGACVTFEGWVRDNHLGRAVRGLEYESYVELANVEGERVLAEARERFGLIAVACVHRIGKLDLGDMAVWVGVSAGHRDAAFAACRYVIDEIKQRVPIWKRESYVDGDAGWIHPDGSPR